MSKIAMVPGLSSRRSMIWFPGCAISSPTVPITAPICVTLSPNWASGPSRLSNAPPTQPDFNFSHGDGSSNEPSLGSIETAAWPRISRLRSPAPKPGFTSPPCSCSSGDCPANSATYTIKIRTLKRKQLRDTKYEGCKGIIVCDGGCDAITKQLTDYDSYSKKQILH